MSTPNAGLISVTPGPTTVCEGKAYPESPMSNLEFKLKNVSYRMFVGLLVLAGISLIGFGYAYHPLGYTLLGLVGIPGILWGVGAFYLRAEKEYKHWQYEKRYRRDLKQPCERNAKDPFTPAYYTMDRLTELEKQHGLTSWQFYMAFKDNNIYKTVDTLTVVEWMGLIYKLFEFGETVPSELDEELSLGLDKKGE